VIKLDVNKFGNNALKYKDYDFIDVGDFTYGDPVLLRWGKKNDCHLKIGKFCSIGAGVEIYFGGEHRHDWVSTYPFGTLNGEATEGHPKSKGDITIGNDVWIGRAATIMSGVTIGDGAVIGARSVVANNVLPYSIVAGNPFRYIKFRFMDDQIVELLKIKWWDWDYEKISRYIPLLESGNVDEFIEGAKND